MAGSGEWSDTMDATQEIQRICDEMKPEVEEKTGKNYLEFKAVKYRNRTGEGKNLLVKVQVGGEGHIIVCVIIPYPGNRGKVVVGGVHQNKTKEDPLIPCK